MRNCFFAVSESSLIDDTGLDTVKRKEIIGSIFVTVGGFSMPHSDCSLLASKTTE